MNRPHLSLDNRLGIGEHPGQMAASLTANEEAQLSQTIEMFEVITQSQPHDTQSLEILKEAYLKLGRQKEVVQTSKRIAQAYVQLGQLSSAILEYESILQRFPDDPDVQAALAEIEIAASSFNAPPASATEMTFAVTSDGRVTRETATSVEIDDGRSAMYKLFVDSKLITANDFTQYWQSPDLQASPTAVVEPFIQILQEKGLVPMEKSVKLLCERSRLSFMPLERYDVEVDLGRSFPRDICRRWCILPFDKMSKTVLVATANPFNKQAVWDLENATQNRIQWYISPPADLIKALRKIFRG